MADTIDSMDDSTNNILVNVSHSAGTEIGVELAADREQNQTDSDHARDGSSTEEMMEDEEESDAPVPDNVRVLIRGLIDHYNLSRQQFAAVYDEYEKMKYLESPEQGNDSGGEKRREMRLQIVGEPTLAADRESDIAVGSPEGVPVQKMGGQELQGEVNRLQSVVQSAMETYVSSPVVANTPRRSLSLPEDPLPSTFARELLQRDQSLVAQAIRKYLHQYSIPQREVVEKTGINQSHLSQHFTRGVPIKPAKRIKLYHWFEQDQLHRTGKLLTADGSLTSVLESPKVEGYRRRPRWRWSPVATQILTEAFKKNRFPTREQRLELSRICNEAESAMNNGEPVQGPAGDTEGITEQRINTWFTNRRKGLVSPSPTKEGFGTLSGLTILQSPNSLTPTAGNLDTPTSDLSLSSGTTTPIRPQVVTSSLTLPINLTTTSSASVTQHEPIALTTPLALSPANLQALLNQLQVQSNAVTPIFTPNLGQILVGQLPQGLMLQSPQGGPVNIEAITKQLQVVEGHAVDTVAMTTTNSSSTSTAGGGTQVVRAVSTLSGEEEIIANTVQPSAINSRQN